MYHLVCIGILLAIASNIGNATTLISLQGEGTAIYDLTKAIPSLIIEFGTEP